MSYTVIAFIILVSIIAIALNIWLAVYWGEEWTLKYKKRYYDYQRKR